MVGASRVKPTSIERFSHSQLSIKYKARQLQVLADTYLAP